MHWETESGREVTKLVVDTMSTGALLVVLALLTPRLLPKGLSQDLIGFLQVLDRMLDGNCHEWVRFRATSRGTRALSLALNYTAGNFVDKEATQRREDEESRRYAVVEVHREVLKANAPWRNTIVEWRRHAAASWWRRSGRFGQNSRPEQTPPLRGA